MRVDIDRPAAQRCSRDGNRRSSAPKQPESPGSCQAQFILWRLAALVLLSATAEKQLPRALDRWSGWRRAPRRDESWSCTCPRPLSTIDVLLRVARCGARPPSRRLSCLGSSSSTRRTGPLSDLMGVQFRYTQSSSTRPILVRGRVRLSRQLAPNDRPTAVEGQHSGAAPSRPAK